MSPEFRLENETNILQTSFYWAENILVYRLSFSSNLHLLGGLLTCNFMYYFTFIFCAHEIKYSLKSEIYFSTQIFAIVGIERRYIN